MAVTGAETSSASGTKPEASTTTKRGRGGNRKQQGPTTVLDDDITRPSSMEPGDAPFDTTDPLERATSVEPDKAAAARAGFGTVNAVIPLPEPEQDEVDEREPRIEKRRVRGPDGKLVTVTRNLETGESKVG